VRADQRPNVVAMSAPPRDQLGNVVTRDLRQQSFLAEEFDQQFQPMLGAGRVGVMLPNLLPVPARNIIEPQRSARGLSLRDQPSRLLTLGGFYFFRFPPGRALCRAVKAMTAPLEIEVPEWRARIFIDGHDTSLQVCAAINSLMS
jgi:hypothetical protein